MNYAPYPSRGTLGDVGLGAVPVTAGWKTPQRELIFEFTQDQGRTPSAAEIAVLQRLAERNNAVLRRMTGGHSPSRTDEMDFNTAQGLINFYLVHGRGPDKGDPAAPPRGGPETEALVKMAVSAVPDKKSFFAQVVSAITHSPIMLLVNPIDGVTHKIIGDKAYYAVARAIGGDKVEAALKAGNNSLADLSKGSTRAELVNQGVAVAKTAIEEKLDSTQLNAVLASLPPETSQAARDALAGKTPSANAPVPAQLRTLDPPKRPTAPAPAPLRTLDPPKRAAAPTQTLAPPQKPTASVSPSTSPVQASAVAPGVFVYAPYPGTLGDVGLGASVTSTLPSGHRLLAGETLTSSNGKGRLVMQTDGNLVLYGPSGALWNTGKNGGVRAEMQTDGNFVVYNRAGHAVFDTKTSGRPGSRLVFQDDGNLVVYERNTPYWNTRTGGWTQAKSDSTFATVISAITHSPVMLLVNPADGILHKVVGDKVYYSVAKAIGGDKVEAALKAGNNSLADLSKGKTRAELLSQGIEVAKVAVQEKLTPDQVKAVLDSLPPETAQAARDALAGKTPSASAPSAPAAAPTQAQLRTLDPPKRPAAAASAPAPLRTLDPPKRAPTQTLAPPQKTASPASPSAGPVQPSAVAPGDFRYAPYPSHAGALSGPPPDCLSLGPPITDMDGGMRYAGLSAVNGSGGRSRMVHGPDGNDYLFALEGGALTARRCFSTGLGAPPPPPHGGHGGGHAHGEHHFSHGGGNRGGHSGWRGFGPWNYVTAVQTCRTWGDPIMMFSEMATAAQEALNASGGRPTTVRGPDGVLYLFAIENGAYTARTCAAVV